MYYKMEGIKEYGIFLSMEKEFSEIIQCRHKACHVRTEYVIQEALKISVKGMLILALVLMIPFFPLFLSFFIICSLFFVFRQ